MVKYEAVLGGGGGGMHVHCLNFKTNHVVFFRWLPHDGTNLKGSQE